MAQTDRFRLPLLAAGQAQKEITHNEALALVDLNIQPVVESADIATPPTSPSLGQCWIVAGGASGAWLDREGSIAGWTAGGWLFAAPQDGWRACVLDRGNGVRFEGADWINEEAREDGFYVSDERVIGARQAAISTPTGGGTQDLQARTAIDAILAALRTHGLIAV
jgi:hypothetical protein